VLTTNPVSSHALARAAHSMGIRVSSSMVTDRLQESEAGNNEEGAR
jgi:multisubunit Na+/H+ antiporter MnhG subunit